MAVGAILLMLAFAVFGGCGGEGESTATAQSPPEPRSKRVGTAGVTVVTPPGWHALSGPLVVSAVVDPHARLVVSSARVTRRSSQCFVASFAPRRDSVTLVVVEWDRTDAAPPARPRRFTRTSLRMAPGGIECFEGRGGTVQFTERGRIFGAYVLLGPDGSDALVDDALSVLDTLIVGSR